MGNEQTVQRKGGEPANFRHSARWIVPLAAAKITMPLFYSPWTSGSL